MDKQNVTEKLEFVYNKVLQLEGLQEKTSNDLTTLTNSIIKFQTSRDEALRKLTLELYEVFGKLETASNEVRGRIARLERAVESRSQGLDAPEANPSLLKPDLKI